MQKKYIPYKSSNTNRAISMRKEMTRAEKKIWFDLLQQRPLGYKFIRQKMIGPYILDFYCARLLLAIEIDGPSHAHQISYDQRRTAYLNTWGITVLRYTNQQVYTTLSVVHEHLHNYIEQHLLSNKQLTTP